MFFDLLVSFGFLWGIEDSFSMDGKKPIELIPIGFPFTLCNRSATGVVAWQPSLDARAPSVVADVLSAIVAYPCTFVKCKY